MDFYSIEMSKCKMHALEACSSKSRLKVQFRPYQNCGVALFILKLLFSNIC